MNYLPLLIFGYLIISNKKSNYKEILSSLSQDDICTILEYFGVDEINSMAISQAIPSLLNGDIDIAKILQIGLPLIGGFLNQRSESVNHSEDFENDDLSTISEIANEEIYSQLKHYFS
jgi:hypothetical protein